MDQHERKRYLETHIPRRLHGFRCQLISVIGDRSFVVKYQVHCRCGDSVKMVLGFPLKDYDPKVQGRLGELFLSPITALCQACDLETQIIDTDLHGYHGEMDGSAKYRGIGSPTKYMCPGFGNTSFQSLYPEFWYDDNAFALFEEPIDFAEYKVGVGIEDSRCVIEKDTEGAPEWRDR